MLNAALRREGEEPLRLRGGAERLVRAAHAHQERAHELGRAVSGVPGGGACSTSDLPSVWSEGTAGRQPADADLGARAQGTTISTGLDTDAML